jgi:hypothetical protein
MLFRQNQARGQVCCAAPDARRRKWAIYRIDERDSRLARVREQMQARNLDAILVYYEGCCPQFESGAVLVPVQVNR